MKKLLTALLALMLACGVPALAEDAAATEATAVPEATAEAAAEAESTAFTPVGTWYLLSFEVKMCIRDRLHHARSGEFGRFFRWDQHPARAPHAQRIDVRRSR